MTYYNCHRPNYRRAREIKAELEELYFDLERSRLSENEREIDSARDILDEIHELKREFFLTGVESEYDL